MIGCRLFYDKKSGLTLIANPKCAATSLKKSLMPHVNENIHENAITQLPVPATTDTVFFGIARNPYSRALSCYKDKIAKLTPIKKIFCERYSIDASRPLSFSIFLQILSKDTKPELMNPHYRPQVFNLLQKHIVPTFLGRLEDFSTVAHFLSRYNVDFVIKAAHATNSSLTYRQEITSEEALLIRKIYQSDFDSYNYSMDIGSSYIPTSDYNIQSINRTVKSVITLQSRGWDQKKLAYAAGREEDRCNWTSALAYWRAALLFTSNPARILPRIETCKANQVISSA